MADLATALPRRRPELAARPFGENNGSCLVRDRDVTACQFSDTIDRRIGSPGESLTISPLLSEPLAGLGDLAR